MNTTMRLARTLKAAAFAAVLATLAACGGGGSGGGADTPPAALSLTAQGSSARTVSLRWSDVPGAAGYTLERKAGQGAWAVVAELPAGRRVHLDDGLEPRTAYAYRVVARGMPEVPPAEQDATTTDAEPVATLPASVNGSIMQGRLGAAGGRLAAPDASVALEAPAGAFAADTAVRLDSLSNTAPGGEEDGVQISTDATPAGPLRLTLGYGEALDAGAQGLGVALQRADGTWLSLPLVEVDLAARRLTVELWPELAGAAAPQGRARAQAATGGGVNLRVAKYLNLMLLPRGAAVPVKGTRVLVPYARTELRGVEEDCTGLAPDDLCIPMPLRELRALPLLNDKPGYVRQWLVEGVEGGNATFGTVAPRSGEAGAVYTAPERAPSPNPVTVAFRSRHQASGRSVELRSMITVREPVWTGIFTGVGPAVDIGFNFSMEGVWALAPDASDTFHATGTQSVHVVPVTCSGFATPGTVALPPGRLTIDTSSNPPRYTLDVGSEWDTAITGNCPGHGSATVPMTVRTHLQLEGTVSGDGTRIEGQAFIDGVQWDWALTSEL